MSADHDRDDAATPSSTPGASAAGSAKRLVGSDPAANASGAMAATVMGEVADGSSLGELVGQTLAGRYLVHRKIGQGGMGAVFEATHTQLGKKVAVKVLLDKYARRQAVIARLEQEARLASAIGHEHIIDIIDCGRTSDGRTYIAMELLDGESLAECLHREGKLPEERVLRLAQQTASALAAAHAKGIVHRDVKPENVFLLQRSGTDFVKVVDFGISKALRTTDADDDSEFDSPRLTHTGMVLGTPLYMSPEQARGDDDLDHRIDVYALGVVMYEASTGQVPFTGGNYLSVISQVLGDDPAAPRTLRPSLSDEFEAIVLRALDKDRNQRYSDAAAMRADITALLDDPARSTVRAKIMAPRRHRHARLSLRTLGWIAGVAVLLAALAVTMVVVMGDPAARAPSPALVPLVPAAIDARPVTAFDAVPAPTVVAIPITSQPLGATIFDGARMVGVTPTAYRATLRDEPATLTARLPGFVDSSFTINPLLDKERSASSPVVVTLQPVPVPAAVPGGRRSGRRPAAASGTTAAPPAPGSAGPHQATGGGDLHGNLYRRGATRPTP